MHAQRRPDPDSLIFFGLQPCAESAHTIRKRLDRISGRKPSFFDAELSAQSLLSGKRQQHNRLQLAWITENDCAARAPQSSRRRLRNSLACLVDQKPPQTFPTHVCKQPVEGGESCRDNRNDKEKSNPRGLECLAICGCRHFAGQNVHCTMQVVPDHAWHTFNKSTMQMKGLNQDASSRTVPDL